MMYESLIASVYMHLRQGSYVKCEKILREK
jgi:hypothetical protein